MKQSSYLVSSCSLVTVFIAAAVLAGWSFNLERLQRISSSFAAMSPMTAIAFILSAIALRLLYYPADAALGRWSRTVGYLLAGIVLGGSLFNITAGFFHFPADVASFNFVLISLALLLMDVEIFQGKRPSQYLGVIIGIMGIIGLAGYIYGIKQLYGNSAFTSMSLHTPFLFIVMAIGILQSRSDRGFMAVFNSEHAGGTMARRILPILVSLPFLIGWLRTRGENAGLYVHAMGMAFFITLNVVVTSLLVWFSARAVNRIDEKRRRHEKALSQAAAELNLANAKLHDEIVRREKAQEALRQVNETLENKVIERTARLELTNRELEAFSYSVSHDLRAPLRSIEGFSKILLSSHASQLDEEGLDYLHRVCKNSRRMTILIDSMLNLSRVTRSEIERSSVDLSQMARAIADELMKGQPDRRTIFAIQPDVVAHADLNLSRVVLDNLLNNAWKFTGKTASGRIELGEVKKNDGSIFYVRDNGVGFDMAYADRLFSPFQRLHSQEDFEGDGVGLATVQRIINRHGGKIWAESEPATKTTFYFTL